MLARVKQDYKAGSVMAFSGHEYVRNEWREVPAGFEEQAKNHPLLDTQPSLDEVRAQASFTAPGLKEPAAVTAETPAPDPEEPPLPVEDPEPRASAPRRPRKRAAED